MAIVRLTQKTVGEVSAADQPDNGKERDNWVYDESCPGFGVRVRPNGRKIFFCQYSTRINGRRIIRRKMLGDYPRVHVMAARAKAKEYLAEAELGGDPFAKKPKPQIVTVKEASALFLREYLPKLKPSTQRDYRRHIEHQLTPVLGKLNLAEVTRQDIASLHASRSKTAPTQANRLLITVSKFFNWCVERGLMEDGPNPVARVGRNREKPRKRILRPDELVRIQEALIREEEEGNANVARAIQLIMAVGARKNEILQAKWQDIDMDNGLLHLPDSKTGEKVIALGALGKVVKKLDNHAEPKGQDLKTD